MDPYFQFGDDAISYVSLSEITLERLPVDGVDTTIRCISEGLEPAKLRKYLERDISLKLYKKKNGSHIGDLGQRLR